MTTIAVDFDAMEIATDTQNTDSANTAYRCRKIDRLPDGSIFLGSGHLLSIGKAKRWAIKGFAERYRPSWDELFGKRAHEYAFSCIVIKPSGDAVLIDDEMEPQPIFDRKIAIGSGGAYAVAAMDAGATAEQAVLIACKRDLYTSEPVIVEAIPQPKNNKKAKG